MSLQSPGLCPYSQNLQVCSHEPATARISLGSLHIIPTILIIPTPKTSMFACIPALQIISPYSPPPIKNNSLLLPPPLPSDASASFCVSPLLSSLVQPSRLMIETGLSARPPAMSVGLCPPHPTRGTLQLGLGNKTSSNNHKRPTSTAKDMVMKMRHDHKTGNFIDATFRARQGEEKSLRPKSGGQNREVGDLVD